MRSFIEHARTCIYYYVSSIKCDIYVLYIDAIQKNGFVEKSKNLARHTDLKIIIGSSK